MSTKWVSLSVTWLALILVVPCGAQQQPPCPFGATMSQCAQWTHEWQVAHPTTPTTPLSKSNQRNADAYNRLIDVDLKTPFPSSSECHALWKAWDAANQAWSDKVTKTHIAGDSPEDQLSVEELYRRTVQAYDCASVFHKEGEAIMNNKNLPSSRREERYRDSLIDQVGILGYETGLWRTLWLRADGVIDANFLDEELLLAK